MRRWKPAASEFPLDPDPSGAGLEGLPPELPGTVRCRTLFHRRRPPEGWRSEGFSRSRFPDPARCLYSLPASIAEHTLNHHSHQNDLLGTAGPIRRLGTPVKGPVSTQLSNFDAIHFQGQPIKTRRSAVVSTSSGSFLYLLRVSLRPERRNASTLRPPPRLRPRWVGCEAAQGGVGRINTSVRRVLS